MSGSDALYAPFEAPWRMSMGLMALAADEWLEVDDDWARDLAEKRRLLAAPPEELVFTLPGAEAAATETLLALAEHLARHHPDRYSLSGDRLALPAFAEAWDLARPEIPAIDLAGRLAREDLCVMQHDGALWRLTAASVCFPTRWRLAEKKGQTLDLIHAPVPGFADKLARPVTRFFDKMKVGHPVWRLNWSLVEDSALYLPKENRRRAPDPGLTAENAGERIWLRVERQTLTRLPRSDAIIFTIAVHRWPLARLARLPEAVVRLGAAIRSMPEPTRVYKAMPALEAAVLGYLDGLRRESATAPEAER